MQLDVFGNAPNHTVKDMRRSLSPTVALLLAWPVGG
jgi:hypothetical protein